MSFDFDPKSATASTFLSTLIPSTIIPPTLPSTTPSIPPSTTPSIPPTCFPCQHHPLHPTLGPHHATARSGAGMGPSLGSHCFPCPITDNSVLQYTGSVWERNAHLQKMQHHAQLDCQYHTMDSSNTACSLQVHKKRDK